MTKEQFARFLREGYYPTLKEATDGLGGLIVPTVMFRDRPGKRAVLWRGLGRVLRSSELYKRGVEVYNPADELWKHFQKVSNA